MAQQTIYGPGWQVDVDQEWIDVTSQFPSPNERWTFTDANGHDHRYDHGYPTLELVVDESHQCDGNEGIWPHDPHEQVDASHYECRTCREVIEPKMDPPFTPKQIPGYRSVKLTGHRSDGVKVTVWLTDEESRSLADATPDDVTALVDSLGDDRIISATFTR